MRRALGTATAIVIGWAGLATGVATAPVAVADCPVASAAGACDLRARIAAADAYLATRPGSIGYVIRDRATGAVYRNAHAGEMVWTASTIKLAMAVDLLTRARAGAISLTDSDRSQLATMIHSSDNDAADALWTRFGGPDYGAFNANFPRYGMTDLRPQSGFSSIDPYWGFQKATANDLDRLINYALTRLEPAQTAAIVHELQNVDPNQQWGVWGAGPAMAPGNKNGWSEEQGGWVTNSVGFAGTGQRYTLAITNALGAEGGYDDGVASTTQLARILLSGLDPG